MFELVKRTTGWSAKVFLLFLVVLLANGSFGTVHAATCGDGVQEGGEECDPGGAKTIGGVSGGTPCTSGGDCFFVMSGGCCKFNCQFVGQGNACNDNNPCSLGEVCNNVGMCACSGSCDPTAGVGSICRASTGECDPAEICQAGTGCPGDTKSAPGTSCTDDGNVCTLDQCNGSSALCQHPAGHPGVVCRPSAGECDPAEACTGASPSCPAQVSPVGASCSTDGNPCTDDVCDSNSTCTHPHNSAPCTDGLFCNGSDTCSNGTCILHAGDPCPSGGECNNAACDETADSCAVSAGTACSTDNNTCTDDVCTGNGSCAHVPNNAPCTDGSFCNGEDTCSGGSCGLHAGDPCSTGAECNNTCNEDDDNCLTPSDTPCTDDSTVCTDDRCDGAGTCAHPSNTASCDDSLFCNGADTCSDGLCGHSGDPCSGGSECADACNEGADNCFDLQGVTCTPDDNVCTDDTCDGNGLCSHPHNTAPCDDDLFCNVGELCMGGTCGGGAPRDCSDPSSDICTADSCDEEENTCVNTPDPSKDGTACDDHDACTTTTSCSGGLCDGGTPVNCDDSTHCTVDSCEPASGCVNLTTVEDRTCNSCLDGIDNDADDDMDADDPGCATLSEAQHFALLGRSLTRKSLFLGGQVSCYAGVGSDPESSAPFPLGPSRAGVCGESKMEILSGAQIAGPVSAAAGHRIKLGGGIDTNFAESFVDDPTTLRIFTNVLPVVGPGNCSEGAAPCLLDVDCNPPASTCEGPLLEDSNPHVDHTGAHEEFVRCSEAKAGIASDEAYIYNLPGQTILPSINHKENAPQPILPLVGSGPHLLHVPKVRIGPGAVLEITASEDAVVVIIVDRGIAVGKFGRVQLAGGLKPENLLWVAHSRGVVSITGSAVFAGTILAPERKIKIGQNVRLDGSLLGSRVEVNGGVLITHRPFTNLL